MQVNKAYILNAAFNTKKKQKISNARAILIDIFITDRF
jgi:hypothetical protein